MLSIYRRHSKVCAQNYGFEPTELKKCECPIWLMGTDARGEYHRESLNTKDTVVANEKMRRIEFGEPIIKLNDLSLAEAWERYAAILVNQRGIKESSLETVYNVTMKKLLAYAEHRGVTRLADIDIDFLDNWISTWGEIAPGTRANRYCAISGMFSTAAARKWITEDPTVLLVRPKYSQGSGKTLPFDLQHEDLKILECLPHWEKEIQRARSSYQNPWARNPRTAAALVLTLRYTGLRISDAIRFEPRVLKKTFMRGRTVYLHYAPKQKKMEQPVFVPIAAAIAEQIISAPRMSENHAFWDGETKDTYWCRNFIPNCLFYISRATGVENIHPHRFRDTFAVDLLSHGADIRSVSRLLGHKQVSTTLNYYEHYVGADQERLINVVLDDVEAKDKVVEIRQPA